MATIFIEEKNIIIIVLKESEKKSLLNSSVISNGISKHCKYHKTCSHSQVKDCSSSTDNDVDELVAMRKRELASKIFHDNQRYHFHTLGYLFIFICLYMIIMISENRFTKIKG